MEEKKEEQKKEMKALHMIAEDYYATGTAEEKRLFHDFFLSLDKDGNHRVSFSEFLDFLEPAGLEDMSNRRFFENLYNNKSGDLGFSAVKTLYYIFKSGRPICGRCKDFIPGLYFTCAKCFNKEKFPFCVCRSCYRETENFGHKHERKEFLDNFALLESKRKEALKQKEASAAKGKQKEASAAEEKQKEPAKGKQKEPPATKGKQSPNQQTKGPSRGSAGGSSVNPPSQAIVPVPNPNPWMLLKIFETSLHLAAVAYSCSIM